MIGLMLKYLHTATHTKYEFCFLCAFSLFSKFIQWTYIAFIIKKYVKFTTHIWEVGNSSPWFFRVRQDFFNFYWNFAALKTETKSLCRLFPKDRAISCGRGKASMMLSFVKKDIETRSHWYVLLIQTVVPTHSTCWVSNKNNKEAHPFVQHMEDISSAFTEDFLCWKHGNWGVIWYFFMKLSRVGTGSTWMWHSTPSLWEGEDIPRNMKRWF